VKLPVIEPYRAYIYISYLKTFNEKTMFLLKKFGMGHVNFSNISEAVSECLDQIFLPDFVVSFDHWLKQQESSDSDRYKNYFKDKDNKWQGKLKSENLYITSLALNIINSTIRNIRECLERFTEDYGRIAEEFDFPEGIDWISMEILGGDRHENGRQPLRISSKSFSVVYKPRCTGIEPVLNKICNIIGFDDICPKTIDKKQYMWQRFVENRGLEEESEAHTVYFNYGSILGIADYLNINDCHFDNFIVDRDKVFFVDAETSFQYFYNSNPDFERSILQTGLLQSQETLINGIGHTSAITAVTSIFQSYTYPHALNDASEKIRVSYERGFSRKTQNFPHIDGIAIQPLNYIDDVASGYEKAFYALNSNKHMVLDVLEQNQNLRPRFLIRTTAYYLLVINQLINPKNSSNSTENFPRVFNEYLCYENAHEGFKQLIPYESKCLEDYDVPIFYIDLNGCALTNGDGETIEDFLPQSPVSQIKENFTRGKLYLERQKELIKWSMNVDFNKQC